MPTREPMYRVARSKIEGKGVYATRKIRKGTKILEYTGTRISKKEADAIGPDVERVLLFDLGDGTFIDGDPQAASAFINHSCDPNCFTEIIDERIFIFAGRTIQPGEELTYDYMFAPDQQTYPCNCGAANCRGTINLPKKKRGRG